LWNEKKIQVLKGLAIFFSGYVCLYEYYGLLEYVVFMCKWVTWI